LEFSEGPDFAAMLIESDSDRLNPLLSRRCFRVVAFASLLSRRAVNIMG